AHDLVDSLCFVALFCEPGRVQQCAFLQVCDQVARIPHQEESRPRALLQGGHAARPRSHTPQAPLRPRLQELPLQLWAGLWLQGPALPSQRPESSL
ncbi:hypothetical protein MC885_011698, partial [Smutsia gigantea]